MLGHCHIGIQVPMAYGHSLQIGARGARGADGDKS